MKKRGQVTLFIIIGLIVVILIALILYANSQAIKQIFLRHSTSPVTLSPEAEKLQTLVQECLESTSLTALKLIGLQGGYLSPPETQVFKTDTTSIAYAYQNKKSLLVTKQKIESQLSAYIEDNLLTCTNYPALNEPKAATTIGQDSVKIVLDYPITFWGSNSSYKLKNPYTMIHNIPLGKIHDTASLIIQNEIENQNIISLSPLLASDLNISILSFNTTIVYSIESGDYKFLLANKLK